MKRKNSKYQEDGGQNLKKKNLFYFIKKKNLFLFRSTSKGWGFELGYSAQKHVLLLKSHTSKTLNEGRKFEKYAYVLPIR